MGLRLNFSTFADLSNDDRFVNDFFNSFKLTAILLFDKNDRGFTEIINQNFKEWSRATGKGLLFITFIYDQLLQDLAPELLQQLHASMEDNFGIEDIDLYDLARRLGVNKRQLPIILLTNNLRGNDAIVIKTTTKDVGKHLYWLAYYANLNDYSGSLDEIDPREFGPESYKLHYRKPIAEMFTEVLSHIQLKLRHDHNAYQWNKGAISRGIQCLARMDDHDESVVIRDEELMNYAFDRIAQRASLNRNNEHPFQIAEQKLLGAEDVSLDMLYTYNLLSTVLDADEIAKHHPDFRIRRYDYSALSLYLGKIFENELSYSIVQQMRELIGIPMPDNYVKYYRSSTRFVVQTGNNKEVDLNKKDRRRTNWIAPSIGEARAAYDRLRLDMPGTSLTIQPQHEELWGYLNTGRNAASHRDPVDREKFMQFFNNFTEFLDDGFFGQLVQIKNQVRGEDSCIIEEQSVLTPLGSAMECETFDGKELFGSVM